MDKQQIQAPDNRIKRLVLARGEVDTLNMFLDLLKPAFLDLGYEIYDFDLYKSNDSLNQLLEYVQKNPVTAIISFNCVLFGATLPTGENVWEKLGIPCVNIFMDHPCWYHENILMKTPSTGIILCIDRNHMNYVNRFYPNISMNGFLAHGGVSYLTEHKPISERKIDVLYAGSIFVNDLPNDFSGWDFPAKEIVEHMINQPEDTFEDAVEKELQKADIFLPDEDLRGFISQCIHLENCANSYYREKILSSIAKAGVSLTIYGNGWGDFDWVKLPNVHYGGRIAPEEILPLMEDSKIVLNTMHWFKDGTHDRVFNAMMCGAVALSETSKYMEEELPPDTWVPFELSKESLSALPGRIQELLSDESAMQKIADAGHDLAVSEHSWKARAGELHRDLLSSL